MPDLNLRYGLPSRPTRLLAMMPHATAYATATPTGYGRAYAYGHCLRSHPRLRWGCYAHAHGLRSLSRLRPRPLLRLQTDSSADVKT